MAAKLELEPADEYMHDNTGEPNFNESAYFNFYDPEARLGGFLRIGNRPNEGYAETTTCLFRPDGSALFNFKRPKIGSNDAFDAGGTRFRVDEPFAKLHVAYEGKACALQEPLAMSDPRAAFSSNPFLPVEVDLAIRGVGPMFGGERRGGAPARETREAMEFARGHFEQHHRATGTVRIDGERTDFDGYGLRDHSWGPRSWQAPRFYRWLTANFGEDFGFMASWIALPDGVEVRSGFVHRGRDLVRVRDVEIDTDWTGTEKVHEHIRARLVCADGEELEVEGRVMSLIPLRNRKDGRVTRISEGMTEWTCQGRTGYGLSEYLDQLT